MPSYLLVSWPIEQTHKSSINTCTHHLTYAQQQVALLRPVAKLPPRTRREIQRPTKLSHPLSCFSSPSSSQRRKSPCISPPCNFLPRYGLLRTAEPLETSPSSALSHNRIRITTRRKQSPSKSSSQENPPVVSMPSAVPKSARQSRKFVEAEKKSCSHFEGFTRTLELISQLSPSRRGEPGLDQRKGPACCTTLQGETCGSPDIIFCSTIRLTVHLAVVG